MMWSIDERIAPFVQVSEVEPGEFFGGALFRRKFGDSPPAFGHHVIAFYRQDVSAFHVASYIHLWMQGSIGLIGGACTDGNVLRAMQPHQLRLVNEAGGLNRQTLRFIFSRFPDRVEAFFGHCGDPRAREVVFPAGFSETILPPLIVRYTRELSPARRRELLDQAHAIGPF